MIVLESVRRSLTLSVIWPVYHFVLYESHNIYGPLFICIPSSVLPELCNETWTGAFYGKGEALWQDGRDYSDFEEKSSRFFCCPPFFSKVKAEMYGAFKGRYKECYPETAISLIRGLHHVHFLLPSQTYRSFELWARGVKHFRDWTAWLHEGAYGVDCWPTKSLA